MYHPVRCLTFCDQCVQCPGCRPHDVAAGFIILRIFYSCIGGMKNRTQQSFTDIIACIVIFSGKILFTYMIENIIDTGNHLIFGKGIRICRIQNCEFWKYVFTKHMTDFQLLFMIGDHRTAVHLRTGPHHGKNAAYWNNLTGYILHPQIIFLPRIFFAMNGNRYSLGIIAYGAASNCQYEIHLIFSCNVTAFPQLFHGRIWHDSAILIDFFSICLQYFTYCIINSVFLNRTSSVYK